MLLLRGHGLGHEGSSSLGNTLTVDLSFTCLICCHAMLLLSTQNIYFQQLPIDFDGMLRPQLFHCFQESQVNLGRALEQAVLESPHGPWNLLMDSPMDRACFLGSSLPHMTLSQDAPGGQEEILQSWVMNRASSLIFPHPHI